MSYVSYDYYNNEFHGSLDPNTFDKLVNKACDVIEIYIASLIPSEKVKSIELYEFDLKKCVCYQIDCLDTFGDGVLNGEKSDNDLKSVSTDGLTYSYNDIRIQTINGIPISPMIPAVINANLSKLGYFNKLVRRC